MIWATASVVLGLLMTVLVVAELWQPVGKVLKIPDRLFVAATFTVALIYGMVVLVVVF